jgi:hypothetical protein
MSSIRSFVSHEPIDNISKCTFLLTESFSIPSNLLSCSIEQFQIILLLGEKYLQQTQSLTESSLRDSFLTSEIQKVTSEIQEAEQEERQRISKSYEKELSNLKKQISELQAELAAASKSESSIRDQERATSQRLLDLMERKNQELVAAKESSLKHREETLLQREAELQTKLLRQASSSLRGQDGELYFESLAKEKMNWNLTDTSKLPHAADYQATIHNVLSLFEVKHYSHPVPQKEITKFIRDMKENPGAHFGAFLSLNTPIQGRDPTQSITIEWIHTNQCVVYVQKCIDLDMDTLFCTLDEIIKITGIVNRMLLDSTTSQEPVYQTRVERAKGGLETTITKLNELVRKIREDRQRIYAVVESNTESRIADLRVLSSTLSRSLELLLGESIEVPEDEVVPALGATPKPKKKAAAKKAKVAEANVVLHINDDSLSSPSSS